MAIFLKFYEWDNCLRKIVDKLVRKGLPYNIAKMILVISPSAWKKKLKKAYNSEKLSPVKKIVDTTIVRKKKQEEKNRYLKIQNSYKTKIKNIRKSVQKEGRIKVAFLVIFDSVFPSIAVFEEMLKDDLYDPYIVVIPDISRGEKHLCETFNRTLCALSEKYHQRVIAGYNNENKTFYELYDDYKIVFFSNPYKHQVNPNHYIDYFLNKDVVTAYIDYGFPAVKYAGVVFSTDFYSKLWVSFIDSDITKEMLKEHQLIQARNAVVMGYSKMDQLDKVKLRTDRIRKKIIICPHHTVMHWRALDISNFEKYKTLFLRIAKDFPEVDFVFRPHPLLFTNLINNRKWKQQDVDSFIEELTSSPNMELDQSGEYFDLFMNSDAMLHDCSSFIGEYLFTEKPCCYMLKSPEQIKETFSELGQACLENYYHAYSEEEIYDFINKVVVSGDDIMKEQREAFAKTVLKKYYPDSSKKIVEYFTKELIDN